VFFFLARLRIARQRAATQRGVRHPLRIVCSSGGNPGEWSTLTRHGTALLGEAQRHRLSQNTAPAHDLGRLRSWVRNHSSAWKRVATRRKAWQNTAPAYDLERFRSWVRLCARRRNPTRSTAWLHTASHRLTTCGNSGRGPTPRRRGARQGTPTPSPLPHGLATTSQRLFILGNSDELSKARHRPVPLRNAQRGRSTQSSSHRLLISGKPLVSSLFPTPRRATHRKAALRPAQHLQRWTPPPNTTHRARTWGNPGACSKTEAPSRAATLCAESLGDSGHNIASAIRAGKLARMASALRSAVSWYRSARRTRAEPHHRTDPASEETLVQGPLFSAPLRSARFRRARLVLCTASNTAPTHDMGEPVSWGQIAASSSATPRTARHPATPHRIDSTSEATLMQGPIQRWAQPSFARRRNAALLYAKHRTDLRLGAILVVDLISSRAAARHLNARRHYDPQLNINASAHALGRLQDVSPTARRLGAGHRSVDLRPALHHTASTVRLGKSKRAAHPRHRSELIRGTSRCYAIHRIGSRSGETHVMGPRISAPSYVAGHRASSSRTRSS